jgi:hypothetical protein
MYCISRFGVFMGNGSSTALVVEASEGRRFLYPSMTPFPFLFPVFMYYLRMKIVFCVYPWTLRPVVHLERRLNCVNSPKYCSVITHQDGSTDGTTQEVEYKACT